jgi:hypothetical protein
MDSKIDRLAASERGEDLKTPLNKAAQHCGLSSISSTRGTHTETLCLRSDEHVFALARQRCCY